jgi:hypothetical protein
MDTKTPVQWAAQLGDTISQNVLNTQGWGWGYFIPTVLNYLITQVEYETFLTAITANQS